MAEIGDGAGRAVGQTIDFCRLSPARASPRLKASTRHPWAASRLIAQIPAFSPIPHSVLS